MDCPLIISEISNCIVSLLLYWVFSFLLSLSFLQFDRSRSLKCDITFISNINLVFSVTIINMLIKLLQTIWCYITRFVVSVPLSRCLYLWCLKDMHFASYGYLFSIKVISFCWHYVTCVLFYCDLYFMLLDGAS